MNYENIKGFKKLTPEQRQLLISTHKRHLASVGNDYKLGYTPIKVKAFGKSLIVKFRNGEWLHYTASGEWY